ncbi:MULTISPECIES: hypothetical protein [unclassified Mesorhizobium]|uniref:hypothetical protein n=1 Tax=unclassified Mesorhizobium TaxID=325217 RepID=UPI00333712A3
MGRSFRTISFAIFLVFVTGHAFAQCAREGEALCQNGQTYRCEKTGSELTPIFQNVPCVVNAAGLNGVWTGSGHQSPAGAAGADWAIAMTIGGSLTQISRDDSSAEYRENISYGQDKCIDGGGITVRFFKGNLSWTWVGQADGQPYNAVAVLKRR